MTVNFSAPGSGPGGTLAAGSAQTDSFGIASMTITANSIAGTFQVNAKTSNGILSTSFQLTNLPGVPSQLVISPIPSTSTAGQALPTFQVQIEDADGNVETTDGASLTLSLNNSGVFTAGTTTAQAVNGVATFSSDVIQKSGNYTLTIGDAADSLSTTTPLTINPGSAATISVSSGSGQTATVGTAYGAATGPCHRRVRQPGAQRHGKLLRLGHRSERRL